jgi:hypothetical protein
MASVVNCTITDSLARGLRRGADRRFAEALERQVLSGQAKSLRGALKSMQKELFRLYGVGRREDVARAQLPGERAQRRERLVFRRQLVFDDGRTFGLAERFNKPVETIE